jgi:oligopeptide/dipeptide ABC transporter ATP-binding protein
MVAIEGVPPNLIEPPSGCAFATRCDQAKEGCSRQQSLTSYEENRQVSCWCAFQRQI